MQPYRVLATPDPLRTKRNIGPIRLSDDPGSPSICAPPSLSPPKPLRSSSLSLSSARELVIAPHDRGRGRDQRCSSEGRRSGEEERVVCSRAGRGHRNSRGTAPGVSLIYEDWLPGRGLITDDSAMTLTLARTQMIDWMHFQTRVRNQ